MRWRTAIGGAVGALAAGAAGACLWLYASVPGAIWIDNWTGGWTDGAAHAVGVGQPVAIVYDRWRIPHIFAGSETDAALALGWAHADDRLWQMDSTRRLGAGRLAEVVGPPALTSDRWFRTLGIYRLAERQWSLLSEHAQSLLTAYAAGVNAWLADRDRPLPPEFTLLSYEPEPWTPVDSLVWLKLMAIRLSGDHRTEMLRAQLADRLHPDRLADLWPDIDLAAAALQAVPERRAEAAELAAALIAEPPAGETGASNAWVVAGSRTTTGKPILANDPHLAFSLPLPWYLAHVVTPQGAWAGATAPGFPAPVLGHNDAVAWGITSAETDVEDLFVERLDPASPDHYLVPGNTLPFTARDETIQVKGEPPVTFTVRATRHGPVITDMPALAAASPDAHGAGKPAVLALAATYLLDDDRTPEALLAIASARTAAEFRDQLALIKAPQMNVTYADRDGHIGLSSAGLVPLRPAGAGAVPGRGWSGEDDWHGFLPVASLPALADPAAGVLLNANNRLFPADYPWPVRGSWAPGFRALRIRDLLDQPEPHDAAQSAAMQVDARSLMAQRLLPMMLDGLPEADRTSPVAAQLRAWDFAMRADQPEPLIFAAWLRALVQVLAADELGPQFSAWWDYRPEFVERVLTTRPVWCDDVTTPEAESCAWCLHQALHRALADLEKRLGPDRAAWRWGDLHQAQFDHPLWHAVPVVGLLAQERIAVDGSSDTLNRAAQRIADPEQPFAAVHGAAFRAVYDLVDPQRSRFILAMGQSGNPLSSHYRDMAALWRTGETIEIRGSRTDVERNAIARTLLVPIASAQSNPANRP